MASLIEIWLPDDPVARGWGGPRWVSTLLAFASILPLLVMRRYPIPALAVSFAAGCGNILLTAPHQASFEGFVALVVLAYGVGAYLETARAVWTIVALDLAIVAFGVLLALFDDYDSLEYAPVPFWFTMAWVVGRAMRSWRLRAEELEGLAAELAAERDARARAAVEAERMRIAHELHDVVAHNVSVMTIQATAASRILESDPEAAREALASVERTGRETVDEMRILLGVLRERGADEPFAPQPGLAELDALAERVGAAGLPVEVVVEGRPRPLAAGLDLAAYRIVQEALTNVLKHAGGAHAQVTVRYTDTRARDRGGRRRCRQRCRRGHRQRARRHAGTGRDVRRPARAGPPSRGRLGASGPPAGGVDVIRVALADDQELVRTGFRMILESEGDITVVGEAEDGAQAVELVRRERAPTSC